MKIHVEIYLAAQMLQRERRTFSTSELVKRVRKKFGDERRGVQTHAAAHCVANAPLHTGVIYNYLWRLEHGWYRCFDRTMDRPHPDQVGGRDRPRLSDVPPEHRWLLRQAREGSSDQTLSRLGDRPVGSTDQPFRGKGERRMGSSTQTLRRMEERVGHLSNRLGEYVEHFETARPFTGPSVYFHQKTMATRWKHSTVAEVLHDDEFFDWLYATLTAWGMHRMGPGNTKLRELEELKDSLRSHLGALEQLGLLRITDIGDAEAPMVLRLLWEIISQLKVSIAKARIVANSKALHHVLPALVPPMDRSYTFNFFYDRTALTISEEAAFREMYSQFHRIAVSNRQVIQARVGTGWNTSETKVIDNAIVGYVLKHPR